MSDDKDFNPDDTHFSDEELEAALAGFEKEFENDTDTGDDDQADSAADAKSIDNGADTQAADDISSSVADAVNEAMSDVVDPSAGFDNELAGLLGDKAKMGVNRYPYRFGGSSGRILPAFGHLRRMHRCQSGCGGSAEES